MAREVDATYVNILSTIENAQDNITEANDRADDSKSAAEDAGYLLEPGESIFIEINNLNKVYIKLARTGGQQVGSATVYYIGT